MNGTPSVIALRSVELNVADLDAATRFYTDVWALERVACADGSLYFRASGPEHHVLVLRSDSSFDVGVVAVELAADDRAAAESVHARLTAAERGVDGEPRELATPGGGYGFATRDALGRRWKISAGVAIHSDGVAVSDRPFKLSHVVLNSPDLAGDVGFAIDDLGFRQRDESKSMIFLGCNADHHSLAFARSRTATLNHIAYEVPSLDAVMRNAGRLKRLGHPMQWGVGRHGPGGNVYSYFLDPENIPIEYTAELLQVNDATYRPGTPSDWERPPFYDAWGLAEPPTPRFIEASSGDPAMAGARRTA